MAGGCVVVLLGAGVTPEEHPGGDPGQEPEEFDGPLDVVLHVAFPLVVPAPAPHHAPLEVDVFPSQGQEGPDPHPADPGRGQEGSPPGGRLHARVDAGVRLPGLVAGYHNSLRFDLVGDGQFHDYDLDQSPHGAA